MKRKQTAATAVAVILALSSPFSVLGQTEALERHIWPSLMTEFSSTASCPD